MKTRGFTLIELLVVVVVIAIVTAAVVVGIGNLRGASVQAESGKIAVAVRYLYNLTVLTGRPHRLVLDLDGKAWWGEEQKSSDPCESFLLPDKDEADAKSAKRGKSDEGEKSVHDGGFEASPSQLLQKTPLDKGIFFAGVMTTHQQQPSQEGQAYVYFFPNGTTEHALIWVAGDGEEDDDAMTVEVLPLQGNAKIHKEKIEADRNFAARDDG
jgi:general secretion pathway protein H